MFVCLCIRSLVGRGAPEAGPAIRNSSQIYKKLSDCTTNPSGLLFF
uniref:Uncharacterized protein n=1 Tax=Siphoviridae sp. ctBLh2 TaxID=2827803 RepID=A0A8S5S4G7_9CAUD|nr:MAG TPA: hypothetical protein [Siphoviridae sp. ctBLh2]